MKRLTILGFGFISLVLMAELLFSGLIIMMPAKVAAEIPVGCPGNTAQGPVATESLVNCPVCYQREPKNYVETKPPIVTRVLNCAGNPNFVQILQNVRGSTMNARNCYIIQAGVHGITAGDPFGSPTCNDAENARIDKTAATPGGGTPAPGGGTTGGGGTSGGTSGGSTPAPGTGAAPHQNNAQKADPTKPAYEQRGEGFESVDTKCNAGNQGKDCAITDRLNAIANILSAGVGIIVVIMIIVGGIQYSMAGGDPGKVAAAKGRIMNAMIALVAYFFLFAFLQWIVPGGIF